MERPKVIGEALDAICDIAERLDCERDSMKEVISSMQNELLTLRDWIERAVPVLNVACCIVIEDSLERLNEIAGCRGLLELCPVNFPQNDERTHGARKEGL